jgi:hypothetical protein
MGLTGRESSEGLEEPADVMGTSAAAPLVVPEGAAGDWVCLAFLLGAETGDSMALRLRREGVTGTASSSKKDGSQPESMDSTNRRDMASSSESSEKS